jgi:hypothetical protein
MSNLDLSKIFNKEIDKKIDELEDIKIDLKSEDEDQKFIKKENFTELEQEEDEVQKDDSILPESHHQRNLDRETGGLEQEKRKEISSKDIWDDRSEEVDKMGSVNAFQKGSVKAMIWKYKKEKLEQEKENKKEAAQQGAEEIRDKANNQRVGNFDSRKGSMQNMSYTQRLKHMKTDNSNQQGGGGIGL